MELLLLVVPEVELAFDNEFHLEKRLAALHVARVLGPDDGDLLVILLVVRGVDFPVLGRGSHARHLLSEIVTGRVTHVVHERDQRCQLLDRDT